MQVREVGPRCSTGSLRPYTRWMNLAINVLDDRTPTYGEKTVPILARFGPQSQYLSAIYARTTHHPELKLIRVTGNRTMIDPVMFICNRAVFIRSCGSICCYFLTLPKNLEVFGHPAPPKKLSGSVIGYVPF